MRLKKLREEQEEVSAEVKHEESGERGRKARDAVEWKKNGW